MPDTQQHTTPLNGHATHHSLEEVRSEVVQEIMGKMPPWIIRIGIYLVALLTAAALAGAWFFHYPEIVAAPVVVRQQLATANIPAAAAWKVKNGQQVLIKLTAYPQEEFGMLQGTVTGIYAAKTGAGFYADIQLTHGRVTSAGKEIPPHPQLDGAAEITTEDKSIAARLFGKLWEMK
ncbi:HlyD family secretion protein [Chitinophaga sp. GbtcB8]|uniref:HlyD family secretion protein n=1 Tax=Chitinophaga sp. GbtcB8 TaxID=2824753 RepID=UPI001C3056AD|nr:HlyD family secretion protein [Chitinophaga sp. GbtcB8]